MVHCSRAKGYFFLLFSGNFGGKGSDDGVKDVIRGIPKSSFPQGKTLYLKNFWRIRKK